MLKYSDPNHHQYIFKAVPLDDNIFVSFYVRILMLIFLFLSLMHIL